MTRQRKTLPARRHQAVDDSLLMRSAESLGRMIGSLQRQLDAARRLTLPSADTVRKNGHAPGRERSGANEKSRAKRAAKKAAAHASTDRSDARTTKTSMKKKPARRASATKRRQSKPAT